MSLDSLVAALDRETRQTTETLIADARASAVALIARADADLAARRNTTAATARAAQREAMERRIDDARLAARREVLAAREAMLDRVMAALLMAIPDAARAPAYLEQLPHQIAAALACLSDDQSAVIRCTPALQATVAEIVSDQRAITLEVGASIGTGFLLATTDGTMEIDASLESRARRQRTFLARNALRAFEETR